MGTVQDGTPDGPKLHSIIVDPRDPAHLYFAMSGGGVHESTRRRPSIGRPWSRACEVVEGFDAATITFHDPHCVRLCPSNPDRLYQQNHCGIYRLDRPGDTWQRIGSKMPKRVGDIGFPMVVHPRDDKVRLGLSDGRHTASGRAPARRAARRPMSRAMPARPGSGRTAGLPADQAWWTVKRQAMTADAQRPGGRVFRHHQRRVVGRAATKGSAGRCIARHLPEIYAVEAAALA